MFVVDDRSDALRDEPGTVDTELEIMASMSPAGRRSSQHRRHRPFVSWRKCCHD
jgi:hypothetical protein